jgi:hypothetical protein
MSAIADICKYGVGVIVGVADDLTVRFQKSA